MYSDWSVMAAALAATVFVWLLVLSFLIWQQGKFLKSLFPRSGERDIRKKFEEILKTVENFKDKQSDLEARIEGLKIAGIRHIQRVELLRFNPYDETGGDISFSACLLDNEGTGMVLTSLHARGGTRIFAKPVIKGKSDKYELSQEEESVIKKAMKQ